MPRGGARNRSGPPQDPTSLRGAKRAGTARLLPRAGYSGKPPVFPLPSPSKREREVWAQAWRTPQACAWADEPWRWRSVAMWVRWSVRMEDPDASAALGNVVVRFADQVGLTPAGLRENGWRIEDGAAGGAEEPRATPGGSSRARLTVVADAAAE